MERGRGRKPGRDVPPVSTFRNRKYRFRSYSYVNKRRKRGKLENNSVIGTKGSFLVILKKGSCKKTSRKKRQRKSRPYRVMIRAASLVRTRWEPTNTHSKYKGLTDVSLWGGESITRLRRGSTFHWTSRAKKGRWPDVTDLLQETKPCQEMLPGQKIESFVLGYWKPQVSERVEGENHYFLSRLILTISHREIKSDKPRPGANRLSKRSPLHILGLFTQKALKALKVDQVDRILQTLEVYEEVLSEIKRTKKVQHKIPEIRQE